MIKAWHQWMLTSFITILFSLFASAVVCYLSLAVPVAPWIDPTLALLSLLGMMVLGPFFLQQYLADSFLIATAAGSVGGMVAAAVAWSLPTLHFLDAALFASWAASPFRFIAAVASLVLVMGSVGLLVARISMRLMGERYAFPIAQAVAQTIAVRESIKQALQLCKGAITAALFHLLQFWYALIPHSLLISSGYLIGWWRLPRFMIHFDFLPIFWAIGSLTGQVIAVPFAVGLLLKLLLLEPLHAVFFAARGISEQGFFLAFCTGLVLEGVVMSFVSLIKKSRTRAEAPGGVASWIGGGMQLLAARPFQEVSRSERWAIGIGFVAFAVGAMHLSLFGAGYVLIGMVISAYQLVLFMGRVGLAPLGRFATFVMVPGLVFFGYTPLQATLVAAAVELAGGVAASASSGIRAVQLGGLRQRQLLYAMQWLALIVSAVAVGATLWLLVYQGGLGSTALVAQRAQTRALLIRVHDMHYGVMLLGAVIGWLLQRLGVSTTLLLGALVMQVDWSLMLIVAGFSTRWLKNAETYTPFWSGMLATSSLWMIGRALLAHLS